MDTSRLATAALTAVLMGMAGSSRSAALQDPTVVVHLDDQLRLPSEDRRVVLGEVERIFHGAGVRISWAGALRRPVRDLPPDGRRHVALAIINLQGSFAPGVVGDDEVLGRAAPAFGLGWAFYNRIEAAVGGKPVDINRVLARVIAHEVGHLILPTHQHAEVGIMRSALGLDHIGVYRFTDDEARRMRAALTTADRQRGQR